MGVAAARHYPHGPSSAAGAAEAAEPMRCMGGGWNEPRPRGHRSGTRVPKLRRFWRSTAFSCSHIRYETDTDRDISKGFREGQVRRT